jgi:hypothetical protein
MAEGPPVWWCFREGGLEIWPNHFGEPIQKTTPTWLDAVLQGLMCEALRRTGYKAGSEVELRIDPEWEPVPDVMATLQYIKDYPTEPVEIVVEILSPEDRVLDPVDKFAWQWKAGSLEAIMQLLLPNGAAVAQPGRGPLAIPVAHAPPICSWFRELGWVT